MPQTPTRALRYPDSTGTTRLWEHFQNLADDVERELAAADKPPLATLWRNSSGNVANATVTTIALNTAPDATHTVRNVTVNYTTGVATIVKPGYYNLAACLGWTANGTGMRGALIYAAGGIVASDYTTAVANIATIQSVAIGAVPLNAGDTVYLAGYQTSGATLAATNANSSLRLSIVWHSDL